MQFSKITLVSVAFYTFYKEWLETLQTRKVRVRRFSVKRLTKGVGF